MNSADKASASAPTPPSLVAPVGASATAFSASVSVPPSAEASAKPAKPRRRSSLLRKKPKPLPPTPVYQQAAISPRKSAADESTPLLPKDQWSTAPSSDSPPGGQGTFWSSVFNLTNSAIGSGILAFPFAFRNAGLILGPLLCIAASIVLAFALRACAVGMLRGDEAAARQRQQCQLQAQHRPEPERCVVAAVHAVCNDVPGSASPEHEQPHGAAANHIATVSVADASAVADAPTRARPERASSARSDTESSALVVSMRASITEALGAFSVPNSGNSGGAQSIEQELKRELQLECERDELENDPHGPGHGQRQESTPDTEMELRQGQAQEQVETQSCAQGTASPRHCMATFPRSLAPTPVPVPFGSYQDLVLAAGGPRVEQAMLILMLIYLFGICLAFLVIVGDIAQPLLSLYAGPGSLLAHRAAPIAVVALFVVLPLCCLRSITALRLSGTFSIFCVLFVVIMMAVSASRPGDSVPRTSDSPPVSASDLPLFIGGASLFTAIPLIGFAFGCHLQLPLVWTAMRRDIRSVDTVNKITFWSYGICLAVYVPAGVLGLLTFGLATPQDILAVTAGYAGYSLNDHVANIARLAFLFSVTCCFPIAHVPARSIMNTLWQRASVRQRLRRNQAGDLYDSKDTPLLVGGAGSIQDSRGSDAGESARPLPSIAEPTDSFIRLEAFIWVCACATLAVYCSWLASVLDLIGSLCGSFEIFIFPGLFHFVFCSGDGWRRYFPAVSLWIIGVVIMVLGTWQSISGIMKTAPAGS